MQTQVPNGPDCTDFHEIQHIPQQCNTDILYLATTTENGNLVIWTGGVVGLWMLQKFQ
jgi:hypothetical protein